MRIFRVISQCEDISLLKVKSRVDPIQITMTKGRGGRWFFQCMNPSA